MASVSGLQARDLQPGVVIRHPVTGDPIRVAAVDSILGDSIEPLGAATFTVHITCDDGTTLDLDPDAPLAPDWTDNHHG